MRMQMLKETKIVIQVATILQEIKNAWLQCGLEITITLSRMSNLHIERFGLYSLRMMSLFKTLEGSLMSTRLIQGKIIMPSLMSLIQMIAKISALSPQCQVQPTMIKIVRTLWQSCQRSRPRLQMTRNQGRLNFFRNQLYLCSYQLQELHFYF